MKITSREQAASEGVEFLWIGFEAGLVASWTAIVDGHRYTLQREPEPVVMYTGEELRVLFRDHPGGENDKFSRIRNLILARRTEMLRAMGSEELVDAVVDETGLLVGDPSAENVISLITEHIEANRPELTDAVIDEWGKEWWSVAQHELDGAKVGTLARFFAHRAAEYRNPPQNPTGVRLVQERDELRSENERLREMYVYLGCFPANTPDEFVESAKELAAERGAFVEKNMVLSTENERLKNEVDDWEKSNALFFDATRGLHDVFPHPDPLTLRDMSEMCNLAASEVKRLRDNQEASTHEMDYLIEQVKPQPVDDSDEYGILVQDGCVRLAEKQEDGTWSSLVRISGTWPKTHAFDPARIFKVTSQPRGPLKVPSEEEMHAAYTELVESYTEEAWLDFETDSIFEAGFKDAIALVKKANGAE